MNFNIQVRETDLHLWQSPPRQVHDGNQSEGIKDVELRRGRQPNRQVKEERTWNIKSDGTAKTQVKECKMQN
jgi:hypothetical protein